MTIEKPIGIEAYKIIHYSELWPEHKPKPHLALAHLIIPTTAKTDTERPNIVDKDYAEYRADCVYVFNITTLDGSPLETQLDTIKYRPGNYIYAQNYKVTTGGIHYFLTPNSALSRIESKLNITYYSDPTKINSYRKYIIPYYNEYLPDGIYYSCLDNGLRYMKKEFRNHLLRSIEYHIHDVGECISRFSYVANDIDLTKQPNITIRTTDKDNNQVGKIKTSGSDRWVVSNQYYVRINQIIMDELLAENHNCQTI